MWRSYHGEPSAEDAEKGVSPYRSCDGSLLIRQPDRCPHALHGLMSYGSCALGAVGEDFFEVGWIACQFCTAVTEGSEVFPEDGEEAFLEVAVPDPTDMEFLFHLGDIVAVGDKTVEAEDARC